MQDKTYLRQVVGGSLHKGISEGFFVEVDPAGEDGREKREEARGKRETGIEKREEVTTYCVVLRSGNEGSWLRKRFRGPDSAQKNHNPKS